MNYNERIKELEVYTSKHVKDKNQYLRIHLGIFISVIDQNVNICCLGYLHKESGSFVWDTNSLGNFQDKDTVTIGDIASGLKETIFSRIRDYFNKNDLPTEGVHSLSNEVSLKFLVCNGESLSSYISIHKGNAYRLLPYYVANIINNKISFASTHIKSFLESGLSFDEYSPDQRENGKIDRGNARLTRANLVFLKSYFLESLRFDKPLLSYRNMEEFRNFLMEMEMEMVDPDDYDTINENRHIHSITDTQKIYISSNSGFVQRQIIDKLEPQSKTDAQTQAREEFMERVQSLRNQLVEETRTLTEGLIKQMNSLVEQHIQTVRKLDSGEEGQEQEAEKSEDVTLDELAGITESNEGELPRPIEKEPEEVCAESVEDNKSSGTWFKLYFSAPVYKKAWHVLSINIEQEELVLMGEYSDNVEQWSENKKKDILNAISLQIMSEDSRVQNILGKTAYLGFSIKNLEESLNEPIDHKDIEVLTEEKASEYFGEFKEACYIYQELSKVIQDINENIELVNKNIVIKPINAVSNRDIYKLYNDTPPDKKTLRQLLRNYNDVHGASVVARYEYFEELDKLLEIYPNMQELVRYIKQSILVSIHSNNTFFFKPVLLTGPKGIGKTSFIYRMSKIFGLPSHKVDFSTVSANFVLSGSTSQWRDAKFGIVFEAMAKTHKVSLLEGSHLQGIASRFVNPIIILDEIDKCTSTFQRDPYGPLHTLLEKDTSREFTDEFIGVPTDASHINWVATANEPDNIPSTILDRFHIIELKELTQEEFLIMSKSVFKGFCEHVHKIEIHPMSDDCLIRLFREGVGLRQFERLLYLCFGTTSDGQARINESRMLQDIRKSKPKMGF